MYRLWSHLWILHKVCGHVFDIIVDCVVSKLEFPLCIPPVFQLSDEAACICFWNWNMDVPTCSSAVCMSICSKLVMSFPYGIVCRYSQAIILFIVLSFLLSVFLLSLFDCWRACTLFVIIGGCMPCSLRSESSCLNNELFSDDVCLYMWFSFLKTGPLS